MKLTRREWAKGAGAAMLLGSQVPAQTASPKTASVPASGSLPELHQFLTPQHEVCLNNARWHPMSVGARKAVTDYLEYKQRGIWQPPDEVSAQQTAVKNTFAAMIHADPAEVAYVNSTTAGESLFVAALGFPGAPGNIVTDGLHFEGSLYMYDALRQAGVDVRVVKPRDWGISPADMDAAIDKHTRLVAVSHVSMINGFEHDMKALCTLAHSRGALVYADAVQAAGSIPIDVRDSGVDAMGSASYKWLMGDMGLGFLYVRRELLSQLRRPLLGYRQLSAFAYHAFPWDSPGPYPVSWKQREDAAGYFELGTYDNATIAALSFSLPYLQQLGVDKIQAHTQDLLTYARQRLTAMGYTCITPASSRGPINTFLVPNVKQVAQKLQAAKLDVSLSTGRMRISPSVYNTREDIDTLCQALA